VKVLEATKIRCIVVFAFISLAFVSQALAVLRPPFPATPAPPFEGEIIIIEDHLVPDSAEKRPSHHWNQATAASPWTERYRFRTRAVLPSDMPPNLHEPYSASGSPALFSTSPSSGITKVLVLR